MKLRRPLVEVWPESPCYPSLAGPYQGPQTVRLSRFRWRRWRQLGHAWYCDCGGCLADGYRSQWQRRGLAPCPRCGSQKHAACSGPDGVAITQAGIDRGYGGAAQGGKPRNLSEDSL